MLVGLCEKEVLNCWCRIFTWRKAENKKQNFFSARDKYSYSADL